MNLRVKTYFFIVVLSVIAMLIAGMYLELIAHVIDYNHTQLSMASNLPLPRYTGIKDTNFAITPEKSKPLLIMDPFSSTSSYPGPPATDKEMDSYPAASSSAP